MVSDSVKSNNALETTAITNFLSIGYTILILLIIQYILLYPKTAVFLISAGKQKSLNSIEIQGFA